MDLLPEFLGILEKQTKIADQLSDIAQDKQSLSDKNIVNHKDVISDDEKSSKLTANDKKRIDEASSIFVKKLLVELPKTKFSDRSITNNNSKVNNITNLIPKTVSKLDKPKESITNNNSKVNNSKVNNITNLIPKTVSKLDKPKEKDDAKLTSNSRSRYLDISTIFISKFFEFQKKSVKDSKEKTLIGKLPNFKDKSSNYMNSIVTKKTNDGGNNLFGWAFILDKLKSLIGLAAGFFVGILPGLVKGTFSQINRLFQTTKLGKITSNFIQTVKNSKISKMVTEPYKYLRNTNFVKKTGAIISNIKKLPIIKDVIGGVKYGYKVGEYIPKVIGNTISTVAKSGGVISKALKASSVVSKMGKVAGVVAKPLAILGLALDGGTSIKKLSSVKGRNDLRKTSENLDFSKKGKFLSTVGKVLFNPIETITSVGVATKDLLDSNKSAKESEKSFKSAQERYLKKMKNKIPSPVIEELSKPLVITPNKILPTYSLGLKNNPSEDKNSKFKISDIPKISPILNIQKSSETSYMVPKDQSKESMSRLESINTQANQYLQAIVNNTALMVKNFTSNGSSSGGGPTVISTSPSSETSSKTMTQILNNRAGYSSSPYALS